MSISFKPVDIDGLDETIGTSERSLVQLSLVTKKTRVDANKPMAEFVEGEEYQRFLDDVSAMESELENEVGELMTVDNAVAFREMNS